MDKLTRHFFAAVLVATAAAGPAFAQVTPGGVPSTTAPSYSEGAPAGGTGTSVRHRHRHHHRARHHRRHHAARPAATDSNSGTGLNGSDAPSR